MANSENLDKFIAEGTWGDFERLDKTLKAATDGVEAATKAMSQLGTAAAALFKDLGGITSLKELVTLTEKASKINADMATSTAKVTKGIKELTEEQIKHNLSIKQQNDLLKLRVAAATAPDNSIAKERAEAALLRRELAGLDLQKQKARQQEIIDILAVKDANIKNNVDLYTKQKINIGNYPETIGQITFLQKELAALAATGQQDSDEFRKLDATMRQFQEGLGPTSSQLGTVTTSMQQLFLAGKQDSDEFRNLAGYAVDLKGKLIDAKSAIDAATGAVTVQESAFDKLSSDYAQASAKVKDYATQMVLLQNDISKGINVEENSKKLLSLGSNLKVVQDEVLGFHRQLAKVGEVAAAANPNISKFNGSAFAMTQILREAPSFAYSFSTGLLGISNNIPILVDEIEKLNEANKLLAAEGKAPVSVLNTLAGSILSINGLITIGVAALTIFTARMAMSGNEAEKAAGGLTKYEESLKSVTEATANFNATLQSGIKIDKQIASSLIDRLENGNIKNKVAAYSQLRSLLPAVLDDIDKEEIKRFKLTDGMKKQIDATVKLNQEIKNGRNIQKEYVDTEYKTMEQIRLRTEKLRDELSNPSTYSGKIGMSQKTIDGLFEKYKNDRKSDLNFNSDDIHKRIVEINELKQTLANTKSLEESLNKNISQKEFQLGEMSGDTKNKKIKDSEIQDEKALFSAQLKLYEEQIKEFSAYQKKIVDTETESYEARRDALIKYLDFEARLRNARLHSAYAEKQFEIDNAKKKDNESKKDFLTRQETLKTEQAAISQEIVNMLVENKKTEVEEIKKLEKSEVDYLLSLNDSIEKNSQDMKVKALSDLKTMYEEDKINYKQYQEGKKRIENDYLRASLILQRENLKEQIKDAEGLGLPTKKLNEQLFSVNNRISGLPDNKKQSDNALLNKFGITDEEYIRAQSFASAIVDLEGTITDAVKKRHEAEIAMLNEKKALIDQNYQEQVANINLTFQSQVKKDQQIAILQKQKIAEDKKIDDEIKKEKRKAAVADKIGATTAAINAGVVAVINTFKIDPTGILAAIVGAAVAVQIGTIAATPIPQYGDGTEDHPGGLAMVGERYKPEYIFEDGKAPRMVKTPTILNLKKHARVLTEEQMVADMKNNAYDDMQISTTMAIGIDGVIRSAMGEVRDEVKTLTEVVANKTENYFSWNNGELRKSQKIGNAWKHYIDSNF